MIVRDILDLAGKFLRKSTPFYVQFQLLGRCNLRCRHCSVPESLQKHPELQLEGIEKVARNLGRIGTTNLILTGGEPFLRQDLDDIIAACKRHVPYVRLQTNGLLVTEKNLSACVAAGLDGLTISLDSLIPQAQDELIGRPGALPQLLEKIVLINNIFPAGRGPLAVNAILSPATAPGMKDLVDFVDAIGWSISIVPVHADFEGKFVLRKSGERDSRSAEFRDAAGALLRDLEALKASGSGIANSRRYLREAEAFIREHATSWRPDWRGKAVCDSPNLYFAVRPDGTFAVCHDFPFSERVDVAAEDFPDLFRSPEFIARVKDCAANCAGCFYGCYPEYTWMFRSPRNFLETSWGFAKALLQSRRKRLDQKTVSSYLRGS